jgi:hypothetical protein
VLDSVTLFGYKYAYWEIPIRTLKVICRGVSTNGPGQSPPAFSFGVHIMAFTKKVAIAAPVRLSAARILATERGIFLDHLAETSNVSAAARAAGISTARVYQERRRFPAFQVDWHKALTEGYVRLETNLLAEALVAAGGTVSEKTIKARTQKYRLGMALLAAHRAAVRGEVAYKAMAKPVGTAKKRIEAHLAEMHARMNDED